MEDFEKNRVEYVVHLENQVKHLQKQLQEAQLSARWEPKVGTSLDAMAGQARITLSFDGKNQTVAIPYEMIRTSTTNNISAEVVDAMKELILDRFHAVLGPELGRIATGVKGIQKAGQW